MPYYVFQNVDNEEEIVEVFQRMTESHIYEKDGKQWKRVFLPTLGAVDTKWDCNSAQNFKDLTSRKKGTLGQIMDKSKELSEERANKLGAPDPVKSDFYKRYSDLRGGKLHPDQRKEKVKEITKNIFKNLGKKSK